MTAKDVANGTLASGAATISFTARYSVIEVKNEDPANPIYITTNGVTPTLGGNDEFECSAGERVSVPNQGPMWWQGFSTNPGTTVMIAGTGSTAYEVVGVA
jgi:hypothetical protein